MSAVADMPLCAAQFGSLCAAADEAAGEEANRDSEAVDALRQVIEAAGGASNMKVETSSALVAAISLDSPVGVRLVVESLLSAQPPALSELDKLDSMGFAPLHTAVELNCLGCIPPLLEARADVNACTADGSYQLAQLSTVYVEGGRTALHIAVEKGNKSAVETLLSARAHVEAQDSFSLTPVDVVLQNLALGKGLQSAEHIAQLFGLPSNTVSQAKARDPDDVRQEQQWRRIALRQRIAEASIQAEALARFLDAQTVRERYEPLNTSIARAGFPADAVGRDVVCWGDATGSEQPFVRSLAITGSTATGVVEPFPGVYVFEFASQDLCAQIWAETEHYLSQAARQGLPLPVRHDGGLDVSRVFPELAQSIASAARSAISAFLPSELHSATLKHAFRTKNYVGRQESFKRHVDKYAVTLNLCLRKTSDVAGSGVFFFESQSAETFSYRHEHEVGLAVLHSSQEWHQTEPLTKGERGSLIVWFAAE